MHIRTNVEMSFIHVALLAICPLILVVNNSNSALYFIVATAVCYLISAIVCTIFNKFFSRSVKIFVTAILSSFLITVFDYLVLNYSILGLTVQENGFFAVITTIILSADMVYIDTKALGGNFFIKILRTLFVYVVMSLIFVIVREFLAYGEVFEKQLFGYKGYEFFTTVTFDLLWLGLICFVAELIHRAISKKIDEKRITYQKFVKKIRNEKVFQYDTLRRSKLLVSEIDTNRIDGDKIEEIREKESENEVVEVEENEEDDDESVEVNSKKKKKNKKLKFSKEAKEEKLKVRQAKEGK